MGTLVERAGERLLVVCHLQPKVKRGLRRGGIQALCQSGHHRVELPSIRFPIRLNVGFILPGQGAGPLRG